MEILGPSISVLVSPGRQNEFSENVMRLQRGAHIEKYETKRIHNDGHPVDVSVTISPVKNKGGIVVGASVWRPVTSPCKNRPPPPCA